MRGEEGSRGQVMNRRAALGVTWPRLPPHHRGNRLASKNMIDRRIQVWYKYVARRRQVGDAARPAN